MQKRSFFVVLTAMLFLAFAAVGQELADKKPSMFGDKATSNEAVNRYLALNSPAPTANLVAGETADDPVAIPAAGDTSLEDEAAMLNDPPARPRRRIAKARPRASRPAATRGFPPHTYSDTGACFAALKRGEYYEPSFFSDAKKPPSRPIAFTRGLEADACPNLKVVGGIMRLVPQRAGTLYDFDANGKAIRRHDCGNAAEEIFYPPSPAPVIPPTGCVDILKEGYDWNNVRLAVVPSVRIIIDGSHTVTTDSTGHAKFVGVTVGTHTVTEEVPEGWEQYLVTPAGGQVEVVAGNRCSGVVFKNRQLAPPPQEQPPVPMPAAPPPQIVPGPPPYVPFLVVGPPSGPGFCEELPGPWITKPVVWAGQQVYCHPVRTGIVVAATCAVVGGVWGVGPCGEIHHLFTKGKPVKTWPKPRPDTPFPGGK